MNSAMGCELFTLDSVCQVAFAQTERRAVWMYNAVLLLKLLHLTAVGCTAGSTTVSPAQPRSLTWLPGTV